MAMTVSMSVGRVAVLHDVRKEISANVDVSLCHQNEVFIDKLAAHRYDIEAYTNATFQPYIDEYNRKQTRENRKKDKPYVDYIKEENAKLLQKAEENKQKGIKVATRKPTKLCHEYVLQFGNREDNGVTNGADIERNREAARKTLEGIQRKYPHADILLATYHADEPNGTPHMHILVQFVGEGYEKGLSRQISMSKALENDGFERCQNRGDYAINRWTKEIQDTIMTDILHDVLLEDREVLDEKRQHEDIRFFREKAKKEAEAIQEMRERLDVKVKEAEQQTLREAQKLNALAKVSQQLSDPERTEPVAVELQNGKKVSFVPVPELQRQSESLNAEIDDMKELRDKTKTELNEVQEIGKYLADKDDRTGIRIYDAEIPDGLLRKKSVVVVESDMDADHVRSVFKANTVREGAVKEAQNTLKEAADTIRGAQNVINQQTEILAQAEKERKSLLDRAKEAAEEIVRKARETVEKLQKEIEGLLKSKERLETDNMVLSYDVKLLREEKEKLEPLQKEVEEMQQTHDILSGKLRYEYEKSFFRDWHTMPYGADYNTYRNRGELIALYKDGTIRQVGKNEQGGFDDRTLQDSRNGLCSVGIMEAERSVKVPESLLKELFRNQSREITPSVRLQKLITQETAIKPVRIKEKDREER